MVTSSKRAYATLLDPGLLQPERMCPWLATADPYLCKGYSNTQRQVWVSLWRLWVLVCTRLCLSHLSISGVHKALFEPSEHLWWVWSLILNMISPFLLSCGFSFALEHGAFTPWNTIQQWKEMSFRYTQHLAVSQQNYTE